MAPLNGPLGDLMMYLLPAGAAAGGLLALAIHLSRRPGPLLTGAAVAFAALYAGTVLLVAVDTRLLTMLGYIPFLLVLAATDPAALPADYGWPILGHQLVLLAGVGLWALTAATAVRKATGTCSHCGRSDRNRGWFTAAAARRWGPPVTIAAAAIPALYALTRFAWAAGIPLGISPDFLAMMQGNGMVHAGLGLASMAALGTILTLGLLQRWGSTFPRWIPGLGGRSVPILLAVMPASLVSVVVVPAGATYVRIFASGIPTGIPFDAVNWATGTPTLLWIAWGPLLAAATLAYYLKRRGTCSTCGRDG
ncbi:hypothetical protein D477_019633 [Arthrobacter crystallopoietes BAB-32]|uniref:Uncharacterized protein n=2 Tax=Crystallibacter crystallopoietes TaxID=37928 RepID=N1V2Q3_9MICC|nr:hypothetical protein D477_019633 [Arthrobacter crystallopoietes BAB-32]